MRPEFPAQFVRKSLQIVVCAGIVTLCGRIGFAQNDGADPEAMFRQLDANKDGKLTMSDATDNNRRMLEQIFEFAGKPRSGSITRAEFQQVFERHRSGRGPQSPPDRPAGRSPRDGGGEGELPPLLRQLDTNGDQRISRSELSRLNQLFDRLDTNKDGQLDAEELQAGMRDSDDAPAAGDGSSRPNPPRGNRTELPAGGYSSREGSSGGRSQRANRAGGRGLDGVWRGYVVEGRGDNQNDRQMEIELTVAGNQITGRELGGRRPGGMQAGTGSLGSGTYEMTGDGASGNLDADGTGGPQDGRHFMGIYELEGDTLRWCVSNRGRQRPRILASGQGNYLMVLQRQAQK